MTSRGQGEGEEGARFTPRLITRSESGVVIQEWPLQFIPLRSIRPLNNAMIRRAER